MHALRDRDNLQKILERIVDLAIQGEKEVQPKLYQAEVEFEAKNWEKRNRDHSFQEINQENLNLSDFDLADGQIRLREIKLACMENWN